MTIANRLALIRRHLPGGIGLMGKRSDLGDSITAFNEVGKCTLFVTAGVPFSAKQAAENFVWRLS